MEFAVMCNSERFTMFVRNELVQLGVKCVNEKKFSKPLKEKKVCSNGIFHTQLSMLEMAEVLTATRSVVQIPKFVAKACKRILQEVETEGLFRLVGSENRQKHMRAAFDTDLLLGPKHNVIDIACIVKYFFRELPEPLISPAMQEAFLECLLVGENHGLAILLTCLLLPPLTRNTLAYFMQFLYSVSLNAAKNKMTVENLVRIFTPTLMPCYNFSIVRFNNHQQVMHFLIKNANRVGVLPDHFIPKLRLAFNVPIFPLDGNQPVEPRNLKKRYSDLLSGVRKLAGSSRPEKSDGVLEKHPELIYPQAGDPQLNQSFTETRVKLAKRKNFAEHIYDRLTKKKLGLSDAALPTASSEIEPKETVEELPMEIDTPLAATRVNSGWRRPSKDNTFALKKDESIGVQESSAVNAVTLIDKTKQTFPVTKNESAQAKIGDIAPNEGQSREELIQTMAELEDSISEMLTGMRYTPSLRLPRCTESSVGSGSICTDSDNDNNDSFVSAPEIFSSSSNDDENNQPVAARIRSHGRNRTQPEVEDMFCDTPEGSPIRTHANSAPAKSSLKRGRPNTVNTGLTPPHYTLVQNRSPASEVDFSNELWTPGEIYFGCNGVKSAAATATSTAMEDEGVTYVRESRNARSESTVVDKDYRRAKPVSRTLSLSNSPPKTERKKATATRRYLQTTPKSVAVKERPSILTLRVQKAGWVMERTKFFNALGEHCDQNLPPVDNNKMEHCENADQSPRNKSLERKADEDEDDQQGMEFDF